MTREHWGLVFLAGMGGLAYYMFREKKPAASKQPVVGTGTATGADPGGIGTGYVPALVVDNENPMGLSVLDTTKDETPFNLHLGEGIGNTPTSGMAGKLSLGGFADTFSMFQ